jgi:hypothetical protein
MLKNAGHTCSGPLANCATDAPAAARYAGTALGVSRRKSKLDIAVIGPEKFAFQDMACIELALSFRPFGTFALVPEPQGGEDASLTWDAAPAQTLENQVKGTAGTAGIPELAGYLLHYPGRRASGSLLERLIDDDTRYVLFILTARCIDDLVVGAAVYRAARHTTGARALAAALREELGRMAAGKPAADRL